MLPKFCFSESPSTIPQVFLCLCSPPVGSMLPKFCFSVSPSTIPQILWHITKLYRQTRRILAEVASGKQLSTLFLIILIFVTSTSSFHVETLLYKRGINWTLCPNQRVSNGQGPRDRAGLSRLLSQLIILFLTPAQPEGIKRAGTQRQSGGIRTSISSDPLVTDPGTTSNGQSCSIATIMPHSSSYRSSHRGLKKHTQSESELLPTPSLSCSSEDSSDYSETFLKCVSDDRGEAQNKNGPQYAGDFSTKSASNQSRGPDLFEIETVFADARRRKDTVMSTCHSLGATERMTAPDLPPKPHRQIDWANRVLPLSQDSRPASIRSASTTASVHADHVQAMLNQSTTGFPQRAIRLINGISQSMDTGTTRLATTAASQPGTRNGARVASSLGNDCTISHSIPTNIRARRHIPFWSVPYQDDILPQSIDDLPPTPPRHPPPPPPLPPKPPASTRVTISGKGQGQGFDERIYKTLKQLLTTGSLRRPETRRDQKRQGCVLLRRKCVLLLSLVSILFSLGPFAFVAFNLITNQKVEQEVCVPCMKLPQDLEVPEKKPLHIKQKDNKYLCCAKSPEQFSTLEKHLTAQTEELAELMEKVLVQLERKEDQPPGSTTPNFQFSPVRAHKMLSALHYKEPSKKAGDYKNLTFNKTRQRYELDRGVRITKNRLIINYSGWYYIYSNVRFYTSLEVKGCGRFEYRTWKLYIYHIRNGENGQHTLASASTQCCEDCTTQDATMFTGGVFHLNRLDRLYVSLSEKALNVNGESSFMGIVMLGSTDAFRDSSSKKKKEEEKVEGNEG
ncbi:tnf ligand-like 3 [Plakobranchus ocellatus]|uniref:Tnf ligand-like 3 n=1 Tax=Plakobranchus ocellatus TaxID=259542 RepID=A0AAV4BTW0_9GAST|nr:tnf ligand-like 3 [Plakobranchus ocellatus]